MPVSNYHGGELHVQNRIQYEYSAPPNLQIKREDANRSVSTCHRAMWVQTRLAWYYIPPPKQEICLYCVDDHDKIFPPPHDFRKQYNNIFITKFRLGKVVQSPVLIDQSRKKKKKKMFMLHWESKPATISLCHNIVFLRLIAWYSAEIWR